MLIRTLLVALVITFLTGCADDPTPTCRRPRILAYLERQVQNATATGELPQKASFAVQRDFVRLNSLKGSVTRDAKLMSRLQKRLARVERPGERLQKIIADLTTIQNLCFSHCEVHRKLWEHP